MRSLRRACMKLFKSSKRGLGVTSAGTGTRDSGVQSQFRKDLIKASNASRVESDPRRDELWCCVTSEWVSSQHWIAGHIFTSDHRLTYDE